MQTQLWYLQASKMAAIIAGLLSASSALAQATATSVVINQNAEATPNVSQDASEADDNDIVVTANKRLERLSDVPMSVTAISGEELAAKGITSVQDLVKLTPGLSYVESGQSVPVYSLRGVGFFDTSLGAKPAVSVYIDEAPLPFSIMTSGTSLDLERVEVLKGPQGTIFGENSTGGAINYIAAKPRDTFGAGATASVERFGRVDLSGFITGPIANNLTARLAVRGVTGGAWQRSLSRDDALGSQRFYQARSILRWDAHNGTRIQLMLDGFVDRSDTQASQFIALAPLIPSRVALVPQIATLTRAPEDNRAADWDAAPSLRRDNDFYQGTLRIEHDLSDRWTVTSLTSYSNMNVHQITDIDGSPFQIGLQTTDGRLRAFTEEARLQGELGPVTALLGASYSNQKSRESLLAQYNESTAAFGYLPFGIVPTERQTAKQTFNVAAVFGNADIRLNDHLIAHAGLRYTSTNLDYAACQRTVLASAGQALTASISARRAGLGLAPVATILPGHCDSINAQLVPSELVGKLDQDSVSWRIGLDYKIDSRNLVYANVSRGFKGGSVPVTGSLSNVSLTPVNQESVTAYEVGVKLTPVSGLVDLTAAAFYYDYTDKQLKGRILIEPPIFGAQTSLVNVPKSRILGAEGQVVLRPAKGLSLSVAGTYIDSKVRGEFFNFTLLSARRDFGGNPFPYTPKWQLVAGVEQRFPVTGRLNATVGADVNYRSSTTAGFGNEAVLAIDGYAVLDLRAGVSSADGRWRAQVFGRNVTNTYYWTNVARYFDTVRRITGQPSTYGVQVGMTW